MDQERQEIKELEELREWRVSIRFKPEGVSLFRKTQVPVIPEFFHPRR